MRAVLTLAVAATALLAGTQASARISDQAFIQANRCAALVAADLPGGPMDNAAIEAKLRTERNSRPQFVVNMGDQARDRASREARHASDTSKQRLVAERDGVCRTYNQ